MKKVLSRISLVSIIISALFGIGLVFEIIEIDGVMGKLLLTILTIGIGSLISLNATNLLQREKNILAIISLILIGLSVLLALIVYWLNFEWNILTKITLIISIFSVLFNTIVKNILVLGKNKLYFQILAYAFIAIFDLFITIQIITGNFLDSDVISKIFIIDIILSLVGIAMLAIFAKKNVPNMDDDGYIKVKKSEYEEMKNRIKELEEQLKNELKLENRIE